MGRVRLTDVTLRDAHQSLFATRMVTADMLPVAAALDGAGFWSLEVWGGATFDTCIRFLNEDPWDRLRRLKAAMPRTPLQMLLRGQNLLGYRHYADDVVEAFVAEAARCGVDVFRVFDALNDPRNLETAMRAVKRAGRHAQAAISYAVTPAHTIPAYVELAARFQAMGADSLCIKDMAGLLKPYEAFALTQAIQRRVALPLQIHSHATTGMSVATLVKAVEAGAELLDTAVSSMAMGTSHSPAETIVEIFRGTPYDTGLDTGLLIEIAAHFRKVRPRYQAFESSFLGADTRILVSQVPGGMLSNLESQLREQDALGKMDAVLKEIAVVQKDFGYPPLVTPTSQIVGTQAVMNVLFGRYGRLTTESLHLLVGLYGATPVPPNPELVQQALRALDRKEPVAGRPADAMPPELAQLEAELRSKTGGGAVSREDVLTYAMFPQVALAFFRARAKGPVTFAAPPQQPPQQPPGPPAPARSGLYQVTVDGRAHRVKRTGTGDGRVLLNVDGQDFSVELKEQDATAGRDEEAPAAAAAGDPEAIVAAPMPGTVVELTCAEGEAVKDNQAVVVLEALKMRMEIRSKRAGRVHYRARAGDSVRAGAPLAEVR